MFESANHSSRIEVWVDMANHFLDTETRHDIPLTALRCLDAGWTVAEARDVWRYEVSPAVAFNVWDIAGEWAAWDREWLVHRIERLRAGWDSRPGTARWLRYRIRVHFLHAVWRATERCMELLSGFAPDERRRAAQHLASLARHYFDFCPPDYGALGKRELERVSALYHRSRRNGRRRRTSAGCAGEGRTLTARVDELGRRFGDALNTLGASDRGEAAFRELLARYREPHRHYHTVEHVDACLSWLDWYAGLAERPAEVALALWFHDAVYDPRAGDNEQRSAELARQILRELGTPLDARERIASCVLATRRHEADQHDARLVLDLDLTILAADAATFADFERRIRLEYAHVPAPLFSAGRREILQCLLAREAIYHLPPFRDRLEAGARANLERRVEELARSG